MNYLIVYYNETEGDDRVMIAKDWDDTPDRIPQRMADNCLIGEPNAVHAVIAIGTAPPEGFRFVEGEGMVFVNCDYQDEAPIPVGDLADRG
jgi:hypothetical protein